MAVFLRKFASTCALGARNGACTNVHVSKTTRHCLQALSARTLVTEDFMRIRAHQREVDRTKQYHESSRDSFLKRLNTNVEEKKDIFLDDVLASIRFAQTDVDLDLAVKTALLYMQQESGNTYHFGPILLRQLYVLNNSDYALKLMDSEELMEVFVGKVVTSRAILSEILFMNEKYEQVIKLNQGVSGWISAFCIMGSALKLNTPEAYDAAKVAFFANDGTFRSTEPYQLMAYIAYLQDDPRTVFEILRKGTYSWFAKQIKIMCYVKHNRVEDATLLFGSMTDVIVPEDQPQDELRPAKRLWFRAVVDALKESVDACDDTNVQSRFAADSAKLTDSFFTDQTMEEVAIDLTATFEHIMSVSRRKRESNNEDQWSRSQRREQFSNRE